MHNHGPCFNTTMEYLADEIRRKKYNVLSSKLQKTM